jgi:hypothetical protein
MDIAQPSGIKSGGLSYETCRSVPLSTVDQITAIQEHELRGIADRIGREVVKVYGDRGSSSPDHRTTRACAIHTLGCQYECDEDGRSLLELIELMRSTKTRIVDERLDWR